MKIILRDPVAEDLPFITATWLNNTFNKQTTPIKKTVFFEHHHELVQNCISKCTGLVACSDEDRDEIYGFIAGEKNVMHFSFVKRPFRRFGIFSLMLKTMFGDGNITFYTHYTPIMKYMEDKYRMVYNPYLFYKEYSK